MVMGMGGMGWAQSPGAGDVISAPGESRGGESTLSTVGWRRIRGGERGLVGVRGEGGEGASPNFIMSLTPFIWSS